jgi:DNA primase
MSTVDEVKARLDIVDVVGGYVRLQKAGRQFKAPCPFHNEKTPSFIVNPDRQSWHCFGACATGGDVISFVSRKENLDFSATLRLLAERAGIELRNDGPRREVIKTLYDLNEAAAVFFHGLLQHTASARAYIEERGLDRGAVTDFLVGYAPAGWDGLRNHLTSRGFPEAQQIESGLVIESDRGGYDRFRDRLMFPIRDDRGRVAGFGGRVLPSATPSERNDPGAKYINTPQTPIFDKGGILYGLDRARDDIRQHGASVIVEGYMDVIAAHQHGFRNVVASMGTALTEKQAALLQRFGERVVLAMDADEAGKAANLRAIQVVAETARSTRTRASSAGGRPETHHSLDIRVLALPQGKDPDELIRADASAWTGAIEAAKPVVDHLIAVVSAGLDLAQPRDRSQLVSEVMPVVGEITDPVLQAHYLQRLSRLARVSEEALRRELPRRARTLRREETDTSRPASPSRRAAASSGAREEFCLALLYREPALASRGMELPEELFSLSENRELLRRWQNGRPVTEEDSWLWDHYQEVLQTRIPVAETGQAEAAFLDCVDRLEGVRLRAVKEASALALAEGEAGVRPGQVASIARARLGAGTDEEAIEDAQAEAAAYQLLEDTENGLRLFRRLIESSRSDQTGPRPQDL